MFAIICDKCGATFKVNQNSSFNGEKVNLIQFRDIWIDPSVEKINRGSVKRDIFLCKDCQNALLEWLDEEG